MYANYLIDLGKLVFILGEVQVTSQFKGLFASNISDKHNIFYKCLDELPPDTFTKNNQIKPGGVKGIIRKDWFTKILDKVPEMVVMVFDCTSPLEGNELWEDRLQIILKKINKVDVMMKKNNKEDLFLRIVVLISKHTFGGINLNEKITNYLKNFEKDLFVIQVEFYGKELDRLKGNWLYQLEKRYDVKYKKVQKRFEQSFMDKKLGCMVKMAILSELISKRDEREKYIETYKSLKYKFSSSIQTVTILTHHQIRELRAVSDVVFFRYLKVLISRNIPSQQLFRETVDHMNFFKLKNLGLQQTHKYYYYEELLWRCTFIENFFQILYSKDLMESMRRVSLCELLNELITYLYALSNIDESIIVEQDELGAKVIEEKQENYVGLISYGTQELLETDIIFSFMKDLISHRNDYLTKGIQLITRYKTMDVFSENQILFLNVYLLKFYLKNQKFDNFLSIYEEITRKEITRANYFLLNQIFSEIQREFQAIKEENKATFYGVSCLICDFFQNMEELENHLVNLLKCVSNRKETTDNTDLLSDETSIQSQNEAEIGMKQIIKEKVREPQLRNNSERLKFSLKNNSEIFAVSCQIENPFVYIEEDIKLKLDIKINPILSKNGCHVTFVFNHYSLNKQVVFQDSSSEFSHTLTITPLEYFSRDETVKLELIQIEPLNQSELSLFIGHSQINFSKYRENEIYSKIKCPEINLYCPYKTLYINELSKFKVQIEQYFSNNFRIPGFKVEAKFSVKEEDVYGKTEVFADFDKRINLTNSKHYQELVDEKSTNEVFWLKCNKVGQKSLKLNFVFTIEKRIPKSKTVNLIDSNEEAENSGHGQMEQKTKFFVLKQIFSVTRELRFAIQNLFKLEKSYVDFSNDDRRPIKPQSIPIGKRVCCLMKLESNEDVLIQEIGLHKNPKHITYLKGFCQKNFVLKRFHKFKQTMIFELPQWKQLEHELELFLMSIYLKWSRICTTPQQKQLFATPQTNLFLDQETKISPCPGDISVQILMGGHHGIQKNQLSHLQVKLGNHSAQRHHVYVQVEGNSHILRIGQKGKFQYIEGNQEEKLLEFDLIAVSSGVLKFPDVKLFVDGVPRQLFIGKGQVIKCI